MRRRRVLFGLVIVAAAALTAVILSRSIVQGAPQLADLPVLPLDGHRRLLILAPHCDDETLSSAGLIQSALQAGMEVRVVIATNGDGFRFATMEEFHRLRLTRDDFIRMGNIRQQESLAALGELGVGPEGVTFLGYPDRGTPSLWGSNWSSDSPYRSPFTGDTRSPYPITFNPASVYSGADLLADLDSILATFAPDLVVYPHPDDVHPDHWGLSAFTRLAIALRAREDPTFRPEAYGYLVHRPDFPTPKGLLPSETLLPPVALYNLYPSSWFRLDLAQDDELAKERAVSQYRSQLPLLRELLVSFVRVDEPFARNPAAALADLASGASEDPRSWRTATGDAIAPIQKDPVLDFITRSTVAAADLTAVYAARTRDGTLVVCGSVRSETEAALDYRLGLLAAGPGGITHRSFQRRGDQGTRVVLQGPTFCAEAGLPDLGDPYLLFVGASVEESGVGTLDQTAWQQVNLTPASDGGM